MNWTRWASIASVAAAVFGLGALGAARHSSTTGQDVIVGNIPNTENWTSGGADNGIRAYSIATMSCNIGDQPLTWIHESNLHPVIAQNMYRLSNGRFEQIGQSWVKHGYCALNHHYCDTCSIHAHGDCLDALYPGCSDPYDADLNGSQDDMGPKSEINAATGYFVYHDHSGGCDTHPDTCKRLQVAEDDLTTSGASYFVSSMYVQPEDAAAHNNDNNESYRPVTVGPAPRLDLTLQGDTQQMAPGILAWADNDTGVTVSYVDVAGDGRFIIASKATSLGGGTYHYEYAVQNINSDRSGRSFTIPLPAGTTLTHIGFHDVKYHSGEVYSGANWTSTVGATSVSWATDTYAQDPNANALRWDTIYNFRFDADAAPGSGAATIGLFKPGATTAPVLGAAVVPGGGAPPSP